MWRIVVAFLLAGLLGLAQAAEIASADLPPEARTTLQLIEQGGPFPYRRDGVTFGNYEKLLPQHPRGYYREYTVPTPGARNRGARRIVAGKHGERFYTDDHYRTFRRIRQ
jgi:ribonuclease T1